MTWPAPALPITFANTTPQQDQHPDAHNETNLTLNADFAPQISANLAAIDGTQLVYRGIDDTAVASVKALSVGRYNPADVFQGNLMTWRGIRAASDVTTNFTSGGAPVKALEVEWPGPYTVGGFAMARAYATVEFDSTASIGGITLGYRYTLGGAITYLALTKADRHQLKVAGDVGFLTVVNYINIPAGSTTMWVTIGVFDSGPSAKITSQDIEVSAFTYG